MHYETLFAVRLVNFVLENVGISSEKVKVTISHVYGANCVMSLFSLFRIKITNLVFDEKIEKSGFS